MVNGIIAGEAKGFSYSPMSRGHKPTLSQESNTLSEASCTTDLSDNSDPIEAEIICDDKYVTEDVMTPYRTLEEEVNDDTITDVHFKPEESEKDIKPVNSDSVVLEIPVEEESDIKEERVNRTTIPGEPLKTLLSLVFLLSGFVTTSLSLALTHERVPETPPLPDIILDNVPNQHWGLDVSEVLLMVSTITAFLVVILHSHRLIILRRIWLVLGLLYYYRAVTMFVTALPKVDQTYVCTPKAENITVKVVFSRVLTIMSGGGLSINGKHIFCGDYIFSGHTMTLTMTYLVIRQYSPSRWFLLHYTSLLTSLLGVIFLLLGRGHYTIDVLLAYFVTTRLWWLYHTLAHNQGLKQDKGENNPLSNICWWHAFRFFERNISTPVPRKYSIPFQEKMWKLFQRNSRSSTAATEAGG